MNDLLLQEFQESILPRHYRRDLSANMDRGYLLFRRGAYVALVMPFADVPEGDVRSKHAKSIVRSHMSCIPFFREKGLFLVYYGEEEKWGSVASKFTVDKTALRPVILQSIHFIDPYTGANVNSRSHWGSLQFGLCDKLIEDIEDLAASIQQCNEADDVTAATDV